MEIRSLLEDIVNSLEVPRFSSKVVVTDDDSVPLMLISTVVVVLWDEPSHGHGYNTWYRLLKAATIFVGLIAIFEETMGIPIDIMGFSTVTSV